MARSCPFSVSLVYASKILSKKIEIALLTDNIAGIFDDDLQTSDTETSIGVELCSFEIQAHDKEEKK
jgi:hypothetical protein